MTSSSLSIKINTLIALIGSVVTLSQIFLLSIGSDGICFNNGCKIIDDLIVVSPLVINAAGFIFFQSVMWTTWFARKGGEIWINLAKLLVLAVMAAEGVLVSFQYLVVKTYCSYCLIILGIVVLLNLFAGFRQLLFAATVFAAVVGASFVLDLSPKKEAQSLSLEQGAYAYLKNTSSEKQLYLFFSSSCPHCEEVMQQISPENTCNIRFNPIQKIESIPVRSAQLTESYSPEINRSFLQGLGIDEIPALTVQEPGRLLVLKGKKQIQDYFNQDCIAQVEIVLPRVEQSTSEIKGFDYLQPSQEDDACSVAVDCEDPESGVQPQKPE